MLHWLTLIHNALLGLVPPYLYTLWQKLSSSFALHSCTTLVLSVPRVRTKFVYHLKLVHSFTGKGEPDKLLPSVNL